MARFRKMRRQKARLHTKRLNSLKSQIRQLFARMPSDYLFTAVILKYYLSEPLQISHASQLSWAPRSEHHDIIELSLLCSL
jgi:hypothetical protein